MTTQERFRPPSHVAPDSFASKILFYLRWLIDFQFNTIYTLLSREMPKFRGKVVDIGCGNCPFEHLVDTGKAEYIGVDVADAEKWDYENSKIITYDGKHLPFETASVDHFICTEVLEHVPDPHDLIADMHRVLKPGGMGIITLPWSARFHYKPYDYHRYTPSTLATLFAAFSEVSIHNRGTDINAIVNKSIVLYFGSISSIRAVGQSGSRAVGQSGSRAVGLVAGLASCQDYSFHPFRARHWVINGLGPCSVMVWLGFVG